MKKYLNPAVLRKDITRFAPLWGLYTVFMLLFLLLMWNTPITPAQFMNDASGIMEMMGGLNLLYAGLCAITLFGDLFNSRMCNMLHAMPVRREGWFWTHFTAGLLFSLAPNTLGALMAAAFLGQYAYGAFLWLAVSLLQFLFYFGVAIFSVMCVGNKLGMVSVYAIINFLGSLVGGFVKIFYEDLLYGITINTEQFSDLCPMNRFVNGQYIITDYDNMTETTILREIPAEPWIHLGIAAAVGVVFLVLALLIYRKRAMETAGDLISLKPATMVFLGIYTLCVGLVFYVIASALSGLDLAFLVIGLAIGYFTGRMLIEKRVAVFRWKNVRNYWILVGVLFLTMGLTWLDPLGITQYVPEADQVESVCVYPYGTGIYGYDVWDDGGEYYYYGQALVLRQTENVETVIGIHKKALEERDVNDGHGFNVEYRMKNGLRVRRSYTISKTAAKALQSIYSSAEFVLGFSDPEKLMESIGTMEVYSWGASAGIPSLYLTLGREGEYSNKVDWTEQRVIESFSEDPMARGLIEALYADCAAGNLAQHYNDSASVAEITLQCGNYETYRRISVTVYADSKNLINYLKNLKLD